MTTIDGPFLMLEPDVYLAVLLPQRRGGFVIEIGVRS
jgi:hypothetical protein